MASDDVEAALRDDMRRAREPMPAARVLDHKLANWSACSVEPMLATRAFDVEITDRALLLPVLRAEPLAQA